MNLNIFLSLLLSFGIIICGDSKDIQRLKKVQSEKLVELSAINEMIAEKEDFIDSLAAKALIVYKDLVSELTDIDMVSFKKDINKYEEKIFASYLTLENLEKFLKEEFLTTRSSRERIKRLKFSFIRRKVEYIFLEELFNRYQKCLEELLELNLQLNESIEID